jgi:hypothetical protein
MAPETERERQGFAEGKNRYEESNRVLKTDDPGHGPEGVVPSLKARIVVGVFDRREDAEASVRELEGQGYPSEDISLVMQQPGSPAEIGASQTKADTGMATGITAGAVLGGIAGLAALAIPGVGAILAAGPLAVALGAMTGAAMGGLVGAFTGLGIPKEEAIEFDQAVRAGGVVVAAKTADRAAEDRACATMERHNVRRCGSYNQAL